MLADRNQEQDIGEMLNEYGNELLRVCFLYLKDVHLAEDAVQDTFIKAIKSYSQFKSSSSVKTWLTRIAINVCKDYHRTNWWRKIDETTILESIPCTDNSTQDDTLLLEIMKLSPKYKEVIILYYYQGLKISEISQVIGVPIATVSTRLKRAKKQLKSKLEGWYYDE